MLILKKVNPSFLYNFSHVKDLNLHSQGLCMINGKNLDDPGSNNDAGKSNLFKSITRLLYDEDRSSTTINSIPNKVLKRGCASCVSFDVEKASYRVILTRGWRSKTSPFDVENSEIINSGDFYKGSDIYLEILDNNIWRDIRDASSSKTKAKIQKILGLTFEQFEASSYMAQNSNFLALSGKPSDKFSLVQPFLDFHVWDKAQEKLEVIMNDLNRRIQDISNKLQIAEASYQNLEDVQCLTQEYEDTCKEIRELEKLIDEDNSNLEEEIKNLNQKQFDFQTALITLSNESFNFQRQSELDSLEIEIQDIKELKRDKKQEFKSSRDSAELLASSMKSEAAVAEAEIKRIKDKIQKTELLGAECQTCGQVINNKEDTLKELCRLLENQMTVKYEVTQKVTSFLNEVENSYLDKIEKLDKECKEKEEFLNSRISELKKQKNQEEKEFHNDKLLKKGNLTSLLKENQSKIDDLNKKIGNKELFKVRIELAEKRRRDISERLASIANKVQRYQEQISKLKHELESLKYDKTQYELLDKHLGVKGIRNFETMTILTELSEYADEFLSKLSGGMVNISISPYKENKDNSKLFSGVSKISELIKDSFKEGVPPSLSGGAVYRQMSIAIMFALRAIAQARGLGTNVLFLDEVDRDMSELNTDRFVNFINEYRNICSSIFIISHNNRLKNTIHHDKEINIVRHNGVADINL